MKIAFCLGVLLAVMMVGIPRISSAQDDRGTAVALVIEVVNLNENVFSHNPLVPRPVSFRVQWEHENASGGTESIGPGVVSSWVIDLGDGNQVTDNDVSNPTYTDVSHTYTTAGPKYITIDAVYQSNGLEFRNEGGRVCIGPITSFDPGFFVSPNEGSVGLNVNVGVSDFPDDAISQDLLVKVTGGGSPNEMVTLNPAVSLSTTHLLDQTGLHGFSWDNNSRACWGTEHVYMFPQPAYNVNVVEDLAALPTLNSIHPLPGVNTPGMDWNARTTDDGSQLYFLSTWEGVPKLYVATESTAGSGDYSNPIVFFAPPEGLTLRAFEMNGVASHFLFDLISPVFGSQLGMIQGVGQDAFRLIELTGFEDYIELWEGPEVRHGLNSFSFTDSPTRLIVPFKYAGFSSSQALSAFDRNPFNQYTFAHNSAVTIRVDQHRRLMSADQSVRVWHATGNGSISSEFNPIYATVEGVPNVSIYTQLSSTEIEDRYRWISIADNSLTFARVDQLSRDGRKLFFTAVRTGGEGSLDIFRADLTTPPTRGEKQAVIVDHVTAAEESAEPSQLDLNVDLLVDSADVETIP